MNKLIEFHSYSRSLFPRCQPSKKIASKAVAEKGGFSQSNGQAETAKRSSQNYVSTKEAGRTCSRRTGKSHGCSQRHTRANQLQSQRRKDHHCLCKVCRRRSGFLGCQMCWTNTEVSLTYSVLFGSIRRAPSSSCCQNATTMELATWSWRAHPYCCQCLPSRSPGTARNELRNWRISIRIIKERDAGRARRAKAIPAKAMQKWDLSGKLSPCENNEKQKYATHKTNVSNKTNKFAVNLHITFDMLLTKRLCVNSKQTCATYKTTFAHYTLCKYTNNTLRNNKQYFVQQWAIL